MHTAFVNLGGVEQPRGTRCSGSTDPASDWAIAHNVLATQFRDQLAAPNPADRTRRGGSGAPPPPKINLLQIGWSDEKHVKTVVGNDASLIERVIPVDGNGDYLGLEEGGALPEPERG